MTKDSERAKNSQKWQENTYLLHLIFQEPYIIWSTFIVHICKRIISSGSFFFFSKIWFLGSLGGKRKKMAENDKKILSVSLRTKEPLMIRL